MLLSDQYRYKKDFSNKNSEQGEFKEIKNKAKSKYKIMKLITEIKIHKSLKHRRIVAFDHVF